MCCRGFLCFQNVGVQPLIHAQEAESASVDPKGSRHGRAISPFWLADCISDSLLDLKSSSSAEWGHAGVYASMDTSGASERRGPVCGKPVSPLKHLPQFLILESALDGLWRALCTGCRAMRQQISYQDASASRLCEASVQKLCAHTQLPSRVRTSFSEQGCSHH